MKRHEVVVTGAGIVSPIGVGVCEFAKRMFAGDSGVVDIRGSVVPDSFPVRAVGRIPRTGAQRSLHSARG